MAGNQRILFVGLAKPLLPAVILTQESPIHPNSRLAGSSVRQDQWWTKSTI